MDLSNADFPLLRVGGFLEHSVRGRGGWSVVEARAGGCGAEARSPLGRRSRGRRMAPPFPGPEQISISPSPSFSFFLGLAAGARPPCAF